MRPSPSKRLGGPRQGLGYSEFKNAAMFASVVDPVGNRIPFTRGSGSEPGRAMVRLVHKGVNQRGGNVVEMTEDELKQGCRAQA